MGRTVFLLKCDFIKKRDLSWISRKKGKKLAPAAGFEPATKWLTATYSTAELCRSVSTFLNIAVLLKKASRLQRKKQLFLTFFCSNPPKSAFPAFPIFNQIRHTAHFQTKTPGERLQLRHTRHRSILIENFTQHPHRRQSGQPNQIHRRFRVPRTLQHPSRPGNQWKHMPRGIKIIQKT